MESDQLIPKLHSNRIRINLCIDGGAALHLIFIDPHQFHTYIYVMSVAHWSLLENKLMFSAYCCSCMWLSNPQ